LRKAGAAETDGTVFRIVRYAPRVAPRHHRTNSIDYAAVISGSMEMELDNETVRLNQGDELAQRGTIHNWLNNGTEPCVIVFVLIGARPATVNGKRCPPWANRATKGKCPGGRYPASPGSPRPGRRSANIRR
jgi:uncharacterized cupin superfamily protein